MTPLTYFLAIVAGLVLWALGLYLLDRSGILDGLEDWLERRFGPAQGKRRP